MREASQNEGEGNMMVHKYAAAKKRKYTKKTYPVRTTTVHEWLKGYLGNSSVQWIDGNTLILWNSPAHRKLMSL